MQLDRWLSCYAMLFQELARACGRPNAESQLHEPFRDPEDLILIRVGHGDQNGPFGWQFHARGFFRFVERQPK